MKLFQPPGDVSPNTTKGDITVYGTGNTRMAVGADGNVLTADSSQATGVKWAAAASTPSQSYEIYNLGLSVTVGSNNLTVAIKQSDGSSDPSVGNPVKVGFRDATATNGDYNERSITGALSMVVNSGSSLGHGLNAEFIYVYLLDNAGTVEVAVSSSLFDEGTLQTTTAEGPGTAIDGSLLYSTTARSSVPIRLIGRMLIAIGVSSHWTNAPTEVSLLPFGKVRFRFPASVSVTGTWSTNILTCSGFFWREGEFLYTRGRVELTGAPNNTALIVNLPFSLTIDPTYLNYVDTMAYVGEADIRDATHASYNGRVFYTGSTNSVEIMCLTPSTSFLIYKSLSATFPVQFGSADGVNYYYKLPIFGWNDG